MLNRHARTLGLGLALLTPAFAQDPPTGLGPGTVLNVDVGTGAGTYTGQGALDDPGNNHWNGVLDVGTDLLASDGITGTGVSVQITSESGFSYGNANTLLGDYRYTSIFGGPHLGELVIEGLTPGTKHVLHLYSAGDKRDQGGIFTFGETVVSTAGSTSDEFEEGENFVVLEVESDGFGVVRGTWGGFDTAGAPLNGFQIQEGTLQPRAMDAVGAESPTVHTPGSKVRVTVEFNETVTLSALGAASLTVDFDGTLVQATHIGATSGTSLSFEADAPSVTTMDAAVVANSLVLAPGATLVDADLNASELDLVRAPLPNDQVTTQRLSVYPPVPNHTESPYYRFRVREVGGAWMSPFAFSTQCIDDAPIVPYGYYQDDLGRWSHTYCNFEMANKVPIEVEITRLNPDTGVPVDIKSAVAHPRRKVRSWRVENGKAYVRVDRPTLFAVDIDGQMDRNPTPDPRFVNDGALHCVTVFANPFILDKPSAGDPGVVTVEAGDPLPADDGSWSTLVFEPGVHQVFGSEGWAPGDAYRLRRDRSYYIPGDAIVHGNFNNERDEGDARNIRIFGHGTISGELMDHPVIFGLMDVDVQWVASPIEIAGDPKGCRVEGITFADPSFHTCAVKGDYSGHEDEHNAVRWCKAISWRANGDGISPNGSSVLEDCFLRTQDDGTYVLGAAIRRVVYWTDVNGMPLRCSQLTKVHPFPYQLEKLLVEDIDVIYARSGFGPGPGRSVIGYPEPDPADTGNTGQHVVFRDISVEDPLPVRSLFGWDLQGGVGAIDGVRFENVRAVAPTVNGDPNSFIGGASAPIEGIVFENVVLAGRHFGSPADLQVIGPVSGLEFDKTAPEAVDYEPKSEFGKWYVNADWSTGVEPANNDVVRHTTDAGLLGVDATAYAGSLEIGAPGTATVEVRDGGTLVVAGGVSIGASGPGELRVSGGVLRVDDASSGAFGVTNGTVHVGRGRILWSGDHVDDVRALHAGGKLTFGGGRRIAANPRNRAGLVAAEGRGLLFAVYDPVGDRTTVLAVEIAAPSRL